MHNDANEPPAIFSERTMDSPEYVEAVDMLQDLVRFLAEQGFVKSDISSMMSAYAGLRMAALISRNAPAWWGAVAMSLSTEGHEGIDTAVTNLITNEFPLRG